MCSDEDYAEFFPPTRPVEERLQQVAANPSQGYLCLDDWKSEDLYITDNPTENVPNERHISLVLVPCNYIHRAPDGTIMSVRAWRAVS